MSDVALPLSVEQLGAALVITFNQPRVRSPLSVAVLGTVSKALNDVESRCGLTHVIFTGVDDVFASGADLNEIAVVNAENAREFAERGQSLMSRIAGLRLSTVAAVNGYCFGGALDLALSCRRRIASPNAQFAHPGGSLGIMTGWGGTQRMPRLVGEAAAMEMFLTGKRVDAHEALSIGLIDEVVASPLEAALYEVNPGRH